MSIPSEPVPVSVSSRRSRRADRWPRSGSTSWAGSPRKRWADLAVATLSLSWSYAGEWEDVGALPSQAVGPPACGGLFDAYGIDPAPERVDFYRRLWNAGDVSSH